MQAIHPSQQVPVYPFEPDEATGNPHFRVYNYEGSLPGHSELLVPHRKGHYLVVFMRRAGSRQWIDMTPVTLRENTVYFYNPGRIIVKEETEPLWSTGWAFTKEFLAMHSNTELSKLPIIQNPNNAHELLLTEADVVFVEDILARINAEYLRPGEWQQRMLTAHLALLLTYLSRLYTEQYKERVTTDDKLLLQQYLAKINEHFHELHEVGDYAALLHISAGHLGEVVKAQSGKPAIKHIHDRLVMEARRLLFHTNSSLKEIGWELGFADASYFSRFFKRETGVTPAAYRSSTREMYH